MTPVKPSDTLLLKNLRDAAAAHDLGLRLFSGFESGTFFTSEPFDFKKEGKYFWCRGFEPSAEKWRIVVTETGPNAAERFLPQPGDWCKFKDHDFIMQVQPSWIWAQRSNNRWGFYINDGAKTSFLIPERIVECPRNGEMIPFPKYEVME